MHLILSVSDRAHLQSSHAIASMELVMPPTPASLWDAGCQGDRGAQHPLAELLFTTVATTAFLFSSLCHDFFFFSSPPPVGCKLLEAAFSILQTQQAAVCFAQSNFSINVFWTNEERNMALSHGSWFLLLRRHPVTSHQMSAEFSAPPHLPLPGSPLSLHAEGRCQGIA